LQEATRRLVVLGESLVTRLPLQNPLQPTAPRCRPLLGP